MCIGSLLLRENCCLFFLSLVLVNSQNRLPPASSPLPPLNPVTSLALSGLPQGLPFSADTQLTQSGGNRETIKWLGVGWVGRASRMFCLSCVGKQWQIHKRQSSDPLNDNKSPLEGLKAHTLHSCWGWRLCVRASQVVQW